MGCAERRRDGKRKTRQIDREKMREKRDVEGKNEDKETGCGVKKQDRLKEKIRCGEKMREKKEMCLEKRDLA